MADHPRSHNTGHEEEKKKKPRDRSSPFMRGLRGLFGFGVEGTSRALERSENVFDRTAEKLKKGQKRRR